MSMLKSTVTRSNCTQVDGSVDPDVITSNFARYFSEIYAPDNGQRASSLHNEYLSLRANYFGFPLSTEREFDTELVSKALLDLKCGKAPDINGLTTSEYRLKVGVFASTGSV